jgi:hypothetical protein
VVKHAHGNPPETCSRVDNGALRVEVRDDGMRGADPDRGGPLALASRISVLDGEPGGEP